MGSFGEVDWTYRWICHRSSSTLYLQILYSVLWRLPFEAWRLASYHFTKSLWLSSCNVKTFPAQKTIADQTQAWSERFITQAHVPNFKKVKDAKKHSDLNSVRCQLAYTLGICNHIQLVYLFFFLLLENLSLMMNLIESKRKLCYLCTCHIMHINSYLKISCCSQQTWLSGGQSQRRWDIFWMLTHQFPVKKEVVDTDTLWI